MNPFEPSSYSPSYSHLSYSADTYRPSRSKDPRLQPRTRRSSRSRSHSPERHHGSSSSSQRHSSGLSHTPRTRELSWSRADIIREEQSRAPPVPSRSHRSSIPSPRPATPPRGTTGTNNVPLTPRRLARDQSNSPTPTNAVTTATPPITSSFNVSSSKSLSTVASFAKGVAPTNTELPSDTTNETKRMKRYREYMEGPPDPPADIIVWTAVSTRIYRKSKQGPSAYNSAYALVWERGPFQHISQPLYGENRSNLYAEFSAISHILKVCPSDATLLIKTTNSEPINVYEKRTKNEAKIIDEVDALRSMLKRQFQERRGRIHWKKVPAKAGLPLNEMARSMAEEARKRSGHQDVETVNDTNKQEDQQDIIQKQRVQQMQLLSGCITSPMTSPSTSQAQAAPFSSSPSSSQLLRPLNNDAYQKQAVEPQRRKMKPPTVESDRLAILLRQKALSSMRSGNRHPSSSPSPTINDSIGSTNNNKITSNGESSMNTVQATHMDEDGRLTKATKASHHTSAPQQQRQQEQYLEQLHQHASGSQRPRDPRLQRKEPAASTTSTTLSSSFNLPRPTRSTGIPHVGSGSYARNGNEGTMQCQRDKHLKKRMQNVIRSSPRTNTVVSRGLSMDKRRSNDHAIQASSSLPRYIVNGSHRTNSELPTNKVQKKIEAYGIDSDSDDEFHDALDHWVGKYREDHGDDDDGEEKKDGSGTGDPSAALSWISNIL